MTEAVRFKIDENLPGDVVDLLRSGGFDARHVLDQGMGGSDDVPLAMACVKERRAIVTLDLDSQTFASTRLPITLASSC